MKIRAALSFLLLGLVWSFPAMSCPDYLSGEYRQLNSDKNLDLCALTQNKAVLVVNTASHCGFTGQFKALESLNKLYRDKGLVIIGFSSNDFKQESGDEEKAAKICFANNGVTFTMLAPTSVRGEKANPLFAQLAKDSSAPSWNFNKYLIDPEGKLVKHFGSKVKPNSKELIELIESNLPQ